MTATSTVGDQANRTRLGAGEKGATGAIRCFYGSTDNGKSAPVRLQLTQHSNAAAAQKQVEVDVQAAHTLERRSQNEVAEYPATLRIIAGGVIQMQYDSWTLSFAVGDKLTSAEALPRACRCWPTKPRVRTY